MSSLPKAASTSPANGAAEDLGGSQQFGRSSLSLRAERAAALFRKTDPRKLDRSASSYHLQKQVSRGRKKASSKSQPSITSPPSEPLEPPQLSALITPISSLISPEPSSDLSGIDSHTDKEERSRKEQGKLAILALTADTTPIPTLINQTTSSDPSGWNAKEGEEPISRKENGEFAFLQSTSSTVSPQPRTPRPLQGRKHKSASNLPEGDLCGTSSPLSLRDLGADYTRYFIPFSDSARSSFLDIPGTLLPRYILDPHDSIYTTVALTDSPVSENPFITPDTPTTKLMDAEQGESLIDDRLGATFNEKYQHWPLFTDEKEDDDDLHMPMPDDDARFKTPFTEHFSRANIVSTLGKFFMIVGLLFLFVALPTLSSFGLITYHSHNGSNTDDHYYEPESWGFVNDRLYPLLRNLRTSLIDPDTPESAKTMMSANGDRFQLVFSDEFNDNNRTFYEGDDPYWYAPDIWYGATKDLEWYDPDAVTTWDGTLEIRLDKFTNHNLEFRSGMLNSWNHACFKGGIFEVSMSLPGPAAIMGLWPGAWTMGNLGRPGYLSTTEGLWPYTYQACDVGITPNQSSYDGLSRLPGQRLPSCTCPGEDHPNPGTGRGAPEIDVVEVGASYGGLPIATQSFQVAPFDVWQYPDYEFTAFPDYSTSYINTYTGDASQQAVSATTMLNRDWYDGNAYQKYSFEYAPGEGEGSYIIWKVGGETTFIMDGRAIGPNGNIQARQVSEEPMSIILNLGISNSWTQIDWANLVFPTVMRVDYVRWYQKKGEESVTCDPPGFETTKYIRDHIKAYTNPNLTKWEQTGYGWPKHKLNSDC